MSIIQTVGRAIEDKPAPDDITFKFQLYDTNPDPDYVMIETDVIKGHYIINCLRINEKKLYKKRELNSHPRNQSTLTQSLKR